VPARPPNTLLPGIAPDNGTVKVKEGIGSLWHAIGQEGLEGQDA
jgi:hypothetical protein